MEPSGPAAPRGAAAKACSPQVWAILEGRAGDDNQLINLAAALGWPCQFKRPGFSLADVLIHRITGSIAQRPGPPGMLAPPWPDLLLTIGGRSVVAARWLKARSGGKTRVVCLGRPWAPLDWFDLVITTPQYRLPRQDNVLHNDLPLNRPPKVEETASTRTWRERIARLPGPYIAVTVGGSNGTYRFDARAAADLAGKANALARASGGSLLISTSPRTDRAAAQTLLASITAPSISFVWRPETRAENPYALFLAVADQIVVTGDSASMIAEACATQASVYLYELPESLRTRILNRLGGSRHRERPAGSQGLRAHLAAKGWWVPRRDMTLLHERLLARGRVARLGEQPRERSGLSDLEMTLRCIRELMSAPRDARASYQ
ncbi:MAG: ELM1/GtrOC1 family putative glycosyltransferase [Pseudomonadales bacterium]